MGQHRLGQCVRCNEEKVIAAWGMCDTCYRRERRDLERGAAILLRSQNKQAKQLIRHYSGLILAIATIDKSEQDDSGLAEWVSNRIEALVEPVRSFIKGHRIATIE